MTKSKKLEGHDDCRAWQRCLPWASGKLNEPRGDICRICQYVYVHGGFSLVYPKVRAYGKVIRDTPERHLEFMETRSRYVSMKIANPRMVLRSGQQDLYPERIIAMVKQRTSSLHKPKQYFMELDEFRAKYGAPQPSQVRLGYVTHVGMV